MSKKKTSQEDEIGPWSEDKLDLLQKYLRAYAVIMNNQKRKGWLEKYHYVDAFAGAVEARAKRDVGAVRYIEGSPLRALSTEPPFDVCWFIDLSEWRSKQLEELKKRFLDRDIRTIRGDCNTILRRDVVPAITRASKQRGVVFLDPYGLQVHWETVKALAATRTLDIFVNFPIMGITRLLPREEHPSERAKERISCVMGSSDWVDRLYASQSHMWDEPIRARDILRAQWLADLYVAQIRELFPYASEPLIMMNSRYSPLYSLFLASHNERATAIVNDISAKYEKARTQTPSSESTLKPLKQPPAGEQTSFLD